MKQNHYDQEEIRKFFTSLPKEVENLKECELFVNFNVSSLNSIHDVTEALNTLLFETGYDNKNIAMDYFL